jgi:hypothetical protein
MCMETGEALPLSSQPKGFGSPEQELRSKETFIAIAVNRVPRVVWQEEIAHVVGPEDKNGQTNAIVLFGRKIDSQELGLDLTQVRSFDEKISKNNFYHYEGNFWFDVESDSPIAETAKRARGIIRELMSAVIEADEARRNTDE